MLVVRGEGSVPGDDRPIVVQHAHLPRAPWRSSARWRASCPPAAARPARECRSWEPWDLRASPARCRDRSGRGWTPVAVRLGVRLNGMRDVAQVPAGARLIGAEPEARFGNVDELLRLGAARRRRAPKRRCRDCHPSRMQPQSMLRSWPVRSLSWLAKPWTT